MADVPLLDKSGLKASQEPRNFSKMTNALSKKLPNSPQNLENTSSRVLKSTFDWENENKINEKVSTLKQDTIIVTEQEFFDALNNRDEDKAKIEKEMFYIEDLYKHAEYLVEFQETYIKEIEKNLNEAEKNSKDAASSLKKAGNRSDCILKFLYSIIGVQSVTAMTLFVLAWIF